MPDKRAITTMKRIHADFNTLTSALVGVMKLAAPGSWQEEGLPLTDGERAMLFDADGLEVEGPSHARQRRLVVGNAR